MSHIGFSIEVTSSLSHQSYNIDFSNQTIKCRNRKQARVKITHLRYYMNKVVNYTIVGYTVHVWLVVNNPQESYTNTISPYF